MPCRKRNWRCLVPPSIRGLGQAGGFQMMVEDRGNLGLEELQKAVTGDHPGRPGPKGLPVPGHHLQRPKPATLPGHRPHQGANPWACPWRPSSIPCRSYLGSSFVNLFNKFNQVFQVYIQSWAPATACCLEDIEQPLRPQPAEGKWCPWGRCWRCRRTLGSELVTRYNLYPAASIFGQTVPGVSSGQGLKLMEEVARTTCPRA